MLEIIQHAYELGAVTKNEYRELLGLPPRDDMDCIYFPATLEVFVDQTPHAQQTPISNSVADLFRNVAEYTAQ